MQDDSDRNRRMNAVSGSERDRAVVILRGEPGGIGGDDEIRRRDAGY